MPGRAWKNPRFEKLKTKWFYTQLGDAVGTAGRGIEVLPLQDEKGWSVGVAPLLSVMAPTEEGTIQRRPSSVESLIETKGRLHERRRSKRDSGIILMSPFSEHFKNAEEASRVQQIPEGNIKTSFDFERMEKNLEKVEKMMEQNVQQMRSLEHVQAANLERLTVALLQNVEMVQELAKGQEGLVHACEELRSVVDKREEAERERKIMEEKAEKDRQMIARKAEKERKIMEEKANTERRTLAEKAEKNRQMIAKKAEKERRKMEQMVEKERRIMAEKAERERKSIAAALEKLERQSRSDQEEGEKRSRSNEVEGHRLTRSQSTMSTAREDTIATLSSCGHAVRTGPRKLGRQVVGYIYASDEHQDVAPNQRDKRKTESG